MLEARKSEQGVRKTVTILFVDIVNSSRLCLALDSEALQNLLTRYCEEMSAVIRRHGGIVARLGWLLSPYGSKLGGQIFHRCSDR